MSVLYPCSQHITPAVDSLHETLKIYNPTRDVYYKMNMHKVMRLWYQLLEERLYWALQGVLIVVCIKNLSLGCRTIRSAV